MIYIICLGILGNSTSKRECEGVWPTGTSHSKHLLNSNWYNYIVIVGISMIRMRYSLDCLVFSVGIQMLMFHVIPYDMHTVLLSCVVLWFYYIFPERGSIWFICDLITNVIQGCFTPSGHLHNCSNSNEMMLEDSGIIYRCLIKVKKDMKTHTMCIFLGVC